MLRAIQGRHWQGRRTNGHLRCVEDKDASSGVTARLERGKRYRSGRLVEHGQADHLLTRRSDAVYVAGVLTAWATRYLVTGEEEAQASTLTAGEPGEVVVTETGNGSFKQRIESGDNVIYADEPASVGGDGTGLSPYELLLAGLGACTSMTLRMYADRKKWPLAGVSVRLRHDRIHARDCEECETREGRVDRIQRKIEVLGPLEAKQRARLLEISERCPVHRTLESEIRIESELSPQSL